MDAAPAPLPLFPLPLVLLPGELLPLHIFEERYKRLVSDCLESGEPFGIVLRLDDGVAAVGCTARLVAVVEEFPDGRSNIVVRGETPFRIESIAVPDDAEREPMRASLVYLPVEESPEEGPGGPAREPGSGVAPGVLDALLARLRSVRSGEDDPGPSPDAGPRGEGGDDPAKAAAAPGEEPASSGEAGEPGTRSFRIAAALDLEPPFKQRLLESRREGERLTLITDYLEKLVPRLEFLESRRDAIRGNGKGI